MFSLLGIQSALDSQREMSSPTTSAVEPKITWSQKLTDFGLILESGEEIKCHKFVLAQNSEVFEAMLTSDMKESKTSQAKVSQFSKETVISFLEYLYTETVTDAKTVALIRNSLNAKKYIYKRPFDEEKLTLELLSMAHMYQVKDLEMDCAQHLKETISDDNVMDIWMEAEKCKNEDLCARAIDHLVERPRGKTLQEVSGFNKAFQDHDKPLKDLLKKLTEKNSHCLEEIFKLKEEISILKRIRITVKTTGSNPWNLVFHVNPDDIVSEVIAEAENIKQRPPLPGKVYNLSKTASTPVPTNTRLKRNWTFLQNGIKAGQDTTLYIWNTSTNWV